MCRTGEARARARGDFRFPGTDKRRRGLILEVGTPFLYAGKMWCFTSVVATTTVETMWKFKWKLLCASRADASCEVMTGGLMAS
jgi:hypothetical protein